MACCFHQFCFLFGKCLTTCVMWMYSVMCLPDITKLLKMPFLVNYGTVFKHHTLSKLYSCAVLCFGTRSQKCFDTMT